MPCGKTAWHRCFLRISRTKFYTANGESVKEPALIFLLSPIFRSSIVFCSLFSLDIRALYLVFIKRGSYNLVTVRARFLSGYSGVGALPLWFAFLPALQGGVAIWQAVQDLPGDIFSYTVFSKRKESIPFPCATMWTTSCSPTQSAWYMWNWASFRVSWKSP